MRWDTRCTPLAPGYVLFLRTAPITQFLFPELREIVLVLVAILGVVLPAQFVQLITIHQAIVHRAV